MCRVSLKPDGFTDFYNPLLILDEYTVMPKPLLLVLLLILNRYNLGAVIYGDKNQLQNIHNTNHAGDGSSYDFVRLVANKEFDLTRNHRCTDIEYNKKVEMLSRYSCADKLDDWAKSLVSAIFYKKFLNRIDKHDIFLASNHIDLSIHLDMLVKSEQIPEEMWLIERVGKKCVKGKETAPNSDLFYPNSTIRYGYEIFQANAADVTTGRVILDGKRLNERNCPGKFLPYTPLIIGQTHFVNVNSESFLGDLVKITFKNNAVYSITMRMLSDNKYVVFKKNNKCKDVMFEKHSTYLLNDGKDHVPYGKSTSGR